MALSQFALRQQVQVGQDVYIFKLGCNSDGTALAAATSENSICVIDPATLQTVRSLEGHTDSVQDVSFFQAAPTCLASCSNDGSARIWDIRAAEAGARSFAVASSESYSCSVGRGDSMLACAASEKTHLFDVAQGKRIRVYKDSHTDVVNHVRFHPVETHKLLTGAEDNLVVILDTNEPREDEAMIGCIPNEECVRSFTMVGPDRNTLCCASTTEDVRIWGIGNEDMGIRRAEFLGLRENPLLMRDDAAGYVIESFYDQPSGQVFLLAGAGNEGDLLLFRVTLAEAAPVAGFVVPPRDITVSALGGALEGHTGIVRCSICMPGGVILTAGEDGRICAWSESSDSAAATDSGADGGSFGLEPTSYGAQRDGVGPRIAPY